MSEPADDELDVKLDLTLLGDTGELCTVMLGAGEPGVLILPSFEDDGTVRLTVTAGEVDAEQLAALLYLIATNLDPTLAESA